MLNSYVDAMKNGNTKVMDDIFHDFMSNMPDIGTLGRSAIFNDAYEFHEQMKDFTRQYSNG